MIECEFGDASCVPESQFPCFAHKARYWREHGTMITVPEHFKADTTMRERIRDITDAAKRDGREIELAKYA